MGDNRLFMPTAFFKIVVAVKDFGIYFPGFYCGEGALNKERLDIGPSPADSGGLFLSGALIVLRRSPAQEQRCFEVGNTDISTPISEMIPIAEKAWIPGAVATMLS